MAERRVAGRPAAPGLFEGALHIEAEQAAALHRVVEAGASGAAALRAAMAEAGAALAALASRVTGDAAEIIGFQLALLEVDALTEGAFHAIEAGVPADAAFAAALDAEINDYQSSGDAVFAARAADLMDLRDRVVQALRGEANMRAPAGAIIAAPDFTPSRFLEHDWSQGGALALSSGSASGHVAILARSRGVPMLVGVALAGLDDGATALLDADAGLLIVDPGLQARAAFKLAREANAAAQARAQDFARRPGRTRDGAAIAVHLNVASLADLDGLDPASCDGIGLTRTEFLFQGERLPDEATQYEFYRRLLAWAQGRPVVIRTLDAGGDKPIKGVTLDGESNPFLGLRGIRLSLANLEIFRVQLRALLRASAHGDLRVMLPMVTAPSELAAARALMGEEGARLRGAGAVVGAPPLGIMVEVPACALALDLFDADFFSIGSNDLTQYVTAAGRDMASVAVLADPAHPAVLRLIAHCARHGARIGRSVSLCGDAAADPRLIPALLDAGLRAFSVAPPFAGLVKQTIAGHDLKLTPKGEAP